MFGFLKEKSSIKNNESVTKKTSISHRICWVNEFRATPIDRKRPPCCFLTRELGVSTGFAEAGVFIHRSEASMILSYFTQ